MGYRKILNLNRKLHQDSHRDVFLFRRRVSFNANEKHLTHVKHLLDLRFWKPEVDIQKLLVSEGLRRGWD